VRTAKRIALGAALSIAVACVVSCQQSESHGDPLSDSTTTLQAQFDALKPGATLQLQSQVFRHGGVLKIRVPGVHIDGNGATLQATSDATSAVQVLADGVELTNIRLTAPSDGPRMTGPDQHKLVISGNDATVSHVTIVGSAAAGIFVNGAQNFTIQHVNIDGTRADGLHMTNGAGHGVVDDVHTDRTGDDGVAVVSYKADGARCHDIVVTNVAVGSTRWGRGMTVVGGTNVTMRNFRIANTSAAGLYVATEGDPYYTQSVDHVTMSDGSVTNANQNPGVVHGAILVAAENAGTAINDVSISNVAVAGTTPSAGRNVAVIADNGGSVSGITLRRIALDDDKLAVFDSNVPASSYSVADWTAGGAPITVS
jgi:Right handed beta helix region